MPIMNDRINKLIHLLSSLISGQWAQPVPIRVRPVRMLVFIGFLNLFWGVAMEATAAPANDNFANGIVTSGSATGSNVGATKEAWEPLHAGNAGGKSVWWFWT